MAKVVVITGASSGIGKTTAEFLSRKGFKVYGLARRNLPIENLNFEFLQCDITNFDDFKNVLERVFNKEGKIDVLINNAGMGIAGAIEHTSSEDIMNIFNINVLALINASKCVIPFMRFNGGGKIINLGSVASVIPIPFQTCYSVTKSAVDMFSMAFGMEVKDFNISLTTVMPGDTKTGFTASRVKNPTLEDENYKKRIKNSIEKMEKDEREGKSPLSVAKVIYKVINKKNPPSRITVGLSYKLIVLLQKILPRRLMLWIVKKIYG